MNVKSDKVKGLDALCVTCQTYRVFAPFFIRFYFLHSFLSSSMCTIGSDELPNLSRRAASAVFANFLEYRVSPCSGRDKKLVNLELIGI